MVSEEVINGWTFRSVSAPIASSAKVSTPGGLVMELEHTVKAAHKVFRDANYWAMVAA